MRPLTPYVSQYVQNAKQFAAWQASQQGQPAPAKPDASKLPYWNPPEFDRSWLEMVSKDGQGNYVAAPGAPPDIVHKVMAYEAFRRQTAEKFFENPFKFIEPHIESQAQKVAERIVEERLGRQSNHQSAQQFVETNAAWLYDIDPATRQPKQELIWDAARGQHVPSPALSHWGRVFNGHLQTEAQRQQSRGYVDVEERKQNAMTRTQLEFAVAQLKTAQQSAPAASGLSPQQLANQQFLQGNNPPAGVPANGGPVMPATIPVNRFNLAEALRANFKANGITDEALSQR